MRQSKSDVAPELASLYHRQVRVRRWIVGGTLRSSVLSSRPGGQVGQVSNLMFVAASWPYLSKLQGESSISKLCCSISMPTFKQDKSPTLGF